MQGVAESADSGASAPADMQALADELGRTLVEGQLSFAGWAPAGPADRALAAGAAVAAEIRLAVKRELGYECSAGIAHSKLLAKIGSARNKPMKQTVITGQAAGPLLASMKLHKVPSLGGKMGNKLTMLFAAISKGNPAALQSDGSEATVPADAHCAESLDTAAGEEIAAAAAADEARGRVAVADANVTVGDALTLSVVQLAAVFGQETAVWLHGYLRGIDERSVKPKGPPKSIMEAKSMTQPLRTEQDRLTWLNNLAQGMAKRVLGDHERHRRWPRTLTLICRTRSTAGHGGSQVCPGVVWAAPTAAATSPPVTDSGSTKQQDRLVAEIVRCTRGVLPLLSKGRPISHLALTVQFPSGAPAPRDGQAVLESFFRPKAVPMPDSSRVAAAHVAQQRITQREH